MCTVTIIQNKDSLDLYMNRDEHHEREQVGEGEEAL